MAGAAHREAPLPRKPDNHLAEIVCAVLLGKFQVGLAEDVGTVVNGKTVILGSVDEGFHNCNIHYTAVGAIPTNFLDIFRVGYIQNVKVGRGGEIGVIAGYSDIPDGMIQFSEDSEHARSLRLGDVIDAEVGVVNTIVALALAVVFSQICAVALNGNAAAGV